VLPRHEFGGYTFCYVHAAFGFYEFLYPGANHQLMFFEGAIGSLSRSHGNLPLEQRTCTQLGLVRSGTHLFGLRALESGLYFSSR
jgi:hypothetical protein